MTRNLYLGADLTPILLALASGNSTAIVGAATQTWAAVQATRPEERMGAIADEIVAADPDAVGLQEVTTWTTYAYNPVNGTTSNPTVAYDFLDLLLDALDERGAGYHEVLGATAHNFSSPPIPYLASPTATFPTRAVSLADRDVIIVRDDVAATNARTGTYETIISFPFDGAPLPVARGWGSADLTVGKSTFRFVNSHLEAFGVPGVDGEQVRVAQVGELLAAQAALTTQLGALPMVYVGDYNSDAPDAPAYVRLLAGVGSRRVDAQPPGRPGLHLLPRRDPDRPGQPAHLADRPGPAQRRREGAARDHHRRRPVRDDGLGPVALRPRRGGGAPGDPGPPGSLAAISSRRGWASRGRRGTRPPRSARRRAGG